MPKHLKKLSEEILHKNPWWVYKHDQYEQPNGKTGDYYYAETKGMVLIVPIKEDGSLVLTLQHRYLEDKQSIEFPGGWILNDMPALECAAQELKEETGWITDNLVKVGSFDSSNGLIKGTCHVFTADVYEQKEQKLDESEEIEVIYRRPDEVDEMVRKNEISDGISLAAWILARHHFLQQDNIK